MQQTIKVQSPGRINIIGEHTDYNDGFVLPAAIDKRTELTLRRKEASSICRITAGNFGETFEFNLNNYAPLSGGWQNYVMGVVHELQQLGAKLSGFEAEFMGTVPIGSGMSSSAALECSFAYGLNELFDLKLEKFQLIKAAQMAEHHFVGIKCGIMDQFASMMGKKNQVMLLDCRSLDYSYFPLDLGDYQFLLLNTKVSHSLADSAYNNRRAACEAGVAIIQKTQPQVKKLRDVSLENLATFRNSMPSEMYQRCYHVVAENHRVLEATKALQQKDFKTLGQLMYQSHFSLQKDYEVSCPELDFLVEQSLSEPAILGSRMMGGGFGGCTINIINKKNYDIFVTKISEIYQQQFNIDLEAYAVSIENGTSLIN